MRILMLAMSMGIGGAETHVLTLSRALAGAGHYVCVASGGGILAAELEKSGIHHTVLPLASRAPTDLWRSVRGVRTVCRDGDFDIIHAHGRIPALAAHMARLADPRVPPCAVTVHGIYDPKARGARFSFWGEGTAAVSEDIADFTAMTYRLPRGGIEIIPNGVEIPPIGNKKSPGVLDIVTSGRLDEDSSAAVLTLLRIFPALCREFEELSPTLTVIGGGRLEGQVREGVEMINRTLRRRAAVMLGAVPDPAKRLEGHGIFVGSSRAAVEAMAAGLPVLLCGNAGVRGLLEEDDFMAAARDNLTCRTAPPTADPDGMVMAELRRFARMSERERAGLGKLCRRKSEESYDIRQTAQKTADFLAKTAQRARPGIIMCGYYGAGNTGDDAALAVMAEHFRRSTPGDSIYAVCRRGGRDGIPEDVKTVTAFPVGRAKKIMRESRLAVLGGGSLLQNATSLRSLAYYAWVVRMAKKAGCRIVIVGGVGPLTSKTAERIAARAVRSASEVYARDSAAAGMFRKLGAKRVCIAPDPASLVVPQKIPKTTAEKILPQGRFFVICPRHIAGLGRQKDEKNSKKSAKRIEKKDENALVCALIEAAKRIAGEHGAVPVFAAMAREDNELCREMAQRTGLGAVCVPQGVLTPGQTVTLMARAETVTAVRLHAAVFAAVAGTPIAVVDIDPKIAGFAADVGINALSLDNITADAIVDGINALI